MPDTSSETRAEAIARLNDLCRLGRDPTARMLITRSCLAEFANGSTADGLAAQVQLVRAVGAHVFVGADAALREAGEFMFRGKAVYFKIDAYDLALEYGSQDPADASVTTRVLTIMLAQDL
ncbi:MULTISPECIES: DUF3768 domain-containing protein [unclassified Sphingomonas]|uniref:DUF3768 domain-containing protein n=1 Tax=unclassified Sphingomonas TaxID=196159 RepID=UPI00226AF374|nr:MULTISPECIES: DUF3768 domain-containing protein [unclassified Sphingomonas]